MFGNTDGQNINHGEVAKPFMAIPAPDYPALSHDFEVAVQPDSLPTYDSVGTVILKQAKSSEGELNLRFASYMPDGITNPTQLVAERPATPDQKAESTETFLRVRYIYKLDFSSAPPDWEPSGLFQSIAREGGHHDFQSAFAIMDRLEGIPSTLMVDFYLGPGAEEQIADSDTAYSWVEIEFEEDAGWITFDAPFLPLQPGE